MTCVYIRCWNLNDKNYNKYHLFFPVLEGVGVREVRGGWEEERLLPSSPFFSTKRKRLKKKKSLAVSEKENDITSCDLVILRVSLKKPPGASGPPPPPLSSFVFILLASLLFFLQSSFLLSLLSLFCVYFSLPSSPHILLFPPSDAVFMYVYYVQTLAFKEQVRSWALLRTPKRMPRSQTHAQITVAKNAGRSSCRLAKFWAYLSGIQTELAYLKNYIGRWKSIINQLWSSIKTFFLWFFKNCGMGLLYCLLGLLLPRSTTTMQRFLKIF